MALIKVLKTWQRSVNYFLANKHKVLLSFLLCLPIHIISFVSAYFLARSLNINISFFDIQPGHCHGLGDKLCAIND